MRVKYFFLPGLLIVIHLSMQAQPAQVKDSVRHFITGNGTEFGLWGGNNRTKPAPVLFILASSIDETLGTEYFRQCGNRLARENGWVCVSLDLPYHGKLQKDTSFAGLTGWAEAIRKGEDIISFNNRRMKDILEYLLRKGIADEKNIYAAGSSRGGYLALQFAASEHRIRSVVAYAPVTKLTAVREFITIPEKDILPVYDLDNQLDSLATKDVWFVIGDRDERVGTDLMVDFAKRLRQAQRAINSPARMELNVMLEPKGHTTPKGSVDRSVNWLLDIWKSKTN